MDCNAKFIMNLSTPICLLELSSCTNGLHSIKLIRTNLDPGTDVNNRKIYDLNENIPNDHYGYPEPLLRAIHWFRQYFRIDTDDDQLNPDDIPKFLCEKIIQKWTNFQQNTYRELLKNVPRGKCMTYSELSRLVIGNRNGARAIGNVMKTNPFIIMIPCHRLIPKNSNEDIGKYCGERDSAMMMKQWLIDHEQQQRKI